MFKEKEKLMCLHVGPVSTTSVFSTASSALTSSTGFGCTNSYTGSVDSSYHKYSPTTQAFHHKSLDDQLKELDSQLLSKVFYFYIKSEFILL